MSESVLLYRSEIRATEYTDKIGKEYTPSSFARLECGRIHLHHKVLGKTYYPDYIDHTYINKIHNIDMTHNTDLSESRML